MGVDSVHLGGWLDALVWHCSGKHQADTGEKPIPHPDSAIPAILVNAACQTHTGKADRCKPNGAVQLLYAGVVACRALAHV